MAKNTFEEQRYQFNIKNNPLLMEVSASKKPCSDLVNSGAEELSAVKTLTNMVNTKNKASDSGNGKVKKTRVHGKHQMAACCHCKKKRKKCDGGYPSCSPCVAAKVVCTTIDIPTGREIPRNYLQILESKINELDDALKNASSSITIRDEDKATESPTLGKDQDLAEENMENARDKGLPLEMGYITLAAAAEPRFIGASSAYSIAKAIHHAIHYYEQQKQIPDEVETESRFDLQPSTDNQLSESSFVKPARSEGYRLLKAYHYGVQCQYPFLDWHWIVDCFQKVMNDETEEDEPLFFIYMIFAVGSQLLEHAAGSSSVRFTRAYYNKAFDYISIIVENTNLRLVQAYLLLSVFSQKMPYGSSIWQTTGLAIRTSVALGLHREPYQKKMHRLPKSPETAQELRSRVFWCAYSMERINGLVLGRPFSIADVDIDTPLPQSEEYSVATHVFKLRILQSSICSFVYKPRKYLLDVDDTDSTRHQIMLELNDWKRTFPYKKDAKTTWETDNWCTISYHNSVLLLLRPVVLEVAEKKKDTPTTTIEWFRIFTQSASAICLNYKQLHTKQKLSYTWLAIQCVYVAGVTFLYCIWLDSSLSFLEWSRRSIIYDTISACSNILYVLAERWDAAKMFRNSFERISRAVLASIDEATDLEEKSKEQTVTFNDKENTTFRPGIKKILSPYHQEALDYEIEVNEPHSFHKNVATDGLSFAVPLSPSNGSSPPINDKTNGENIVGEGLNSLWDFLNSTADNFLKDMFYDLEEKFDTF